MKHTLERKFSEGRDVCLFLSVLRVEEAFGGGKRGGGEGMRGKVRGGGKRSALAIYKSSKSQSSQKRMAQIPGY